MSLSNGALASIYHGTGSDLAQTPTVQILSCKKVSSTAPSNGAPSQDRYRIIVSDGDHFMQAMLATQNNHLVESGQLDKLSILRLDQYACNVISNRKIIIMLGVTPISAGTAKIGDPKSMEEAASNPAPAAAPAAAPAPAPTVMGRGGPATRGRGASSSARGGRQQQSGPSNAPIYPIEGLSPYQNKWTIKARVVNKSDIKHWSNAKGEGKLFSVTLMDETGEIRATGFNDAVDNLYNILEQGKVYFVSKARVNIAKKQFNNVNNEYEIAFGNDSEAELCTDTDNVPEMRFDFVDLSQISELEKDQMTDVLAVVKEVGDLGSITSKATQRPISKRDLVLVDKSSYSIRMTLWGKSAETLSFEAESQPVIAFRGVKVGDFGGRSLSMVSSSTMMVEPDISSAHELRGWYDSAGHQEGFQTHSSAGGGATAGTFKTNEAKTINDVKEEGLGMSDTPQYFDVRATTVFIKQESFSYPACPADRCNKKLIMEGNEEWRCEKCDKMYPAPEYRYVLSLSVGDHSGQCWLSGFNDVGQLILGVSAGELESMRSEDEAAFRKVFQQAAGKTYNFGCRAKSDTYNDQMKVRYQIQRASPVNWVEAGKSLIEKIAAYGIVA